MSRFENASAGRKDATNRRGRCGAAFPADPVDSFPESRAVQTMVGAVGARAAGRNRRSGNGNRAVDGILPPQGLFRKMDQPAAEIHRGAQGADGRVGTAGNQKGTGVCHADRHHHARMGGNDHPAIQAVQGTENREPARQHDQPGAGAQHAGRSDHDGNIPAEKARDRSGQLRGRQTGRAHSRKHAPRNRSPNRQEGRFAAQCRTSAGSKGGRTDRGRFGRRVKGVRPARNAGRR